MIELPDNLFNNSSKGNNCLGVSICRSSFFLYNFIVGYLSIPIFVQIFGYLEQSIFKKTHFLFKILYELALSNTGKNCWQCPHQSTWNKEII